MSWIRGAIDKIRINGSSAFGNRLYYFLGNPLFRKHFIFTEKDEGSSKTRTEDVKITMALIDQR
jgi:hypothetical protein